MLNVKPVPVKIRTEGFNWDLSEQSQVSTNYAALSDAIANNPGLFAVWAVLEAQARRVYDDLVTRMDVLEAELFEAYRASIGSPVDAIKACVKKDARRLELLPDISEAKSNLELLIAGRKTIETRKDSLLALASNYRAEMQGRISVSDRQARELTDRARGSRGTNVPGTKAR